MTEIPLIQLLQAGDIRAYFTTRGQCEPDNPYDGFNVCHYTGDNPDHYSNCILALGKQFGISPDRIVIPRQTHSTNIAVISGEIPFENRPYDIDAIVSDNTNIIIGVNTADCVPVIMIDTHSEVCAVAHAGWRGAAGGIVEKTIMEMKKLGANPDNIVVAMGPSICEDCFEVGEETAQFFADDCVTRTPGQKPHVSLHRHIRKTLLSSGVNEGNITPFDRSICSRCHPQTFWSARRIGINSGRTFTFIVR